MVGTDRAGGWGHTKHTSVTPETRVSHPGNKSTLVNIGERPWFWLNLNKDAVSDVTVNVFCIKRDHETTAVNPKHNHKCVIMLESLQVDILLS